MKQKFKIAVTLLCLCGLSIAQDEELKISGWGSLYFGKVVKGQSNPIQDIDFTGKWLSDFQGGVKFVRTIDEQTHARLHVGLSTAFQVYDSKINGSGSNLEYSQRKFVASILEGAIDHRILMDDFDILLEFGYLPIRYNPQAVNLGEYLIRSMPYPTVIESGFEMAEKVKLMGFHISLEKKYGENSLLKLDSYTHSSVHTLPTFDISQVFMASLNHEKIIEIGAGTELHNLISVDEVVTTPGKTPKPSHRQVYVSPAQLKDTLPNDTVFYTTRGLKLMGRFTFNPVALIMGTENDLFGTEDLKLYAEAAILGVKDYQGWFENMNERLPMMFGVNLPTFKLLDVMSLQLQYLNSRYWNTYENYLMFNNMVPYYSPESRISSETYEVYDTTTSMHMKQDNWKWSLYMSKVVNKRMKFSLQFASDNMFKSSFMPPPPTVKKYTEIMQQTWVIDSKGKEHWGMIHDWYWMARVTFFL